MDKRSSLAAGLLETPVELPALRSPQRCRRITKRTLRQPPPQRTPSSHRHTSRRPSPLITCNPQAAAPQPLAPLISPSSTLPACTAGAGSSPTLQPTCTPNSTPTLPACRRVKAASPAHSTAASLPEPFLPPLNKHDQTMSPLVAKIQHEHDAVKQQSLSSLSPMPNPIMPDPPFTMPNPAPSLPITTIPNATGIHDLPVWAPSTTHNSLGSALSSSTTPTTRAEIRNHEGTLFFARAHKRNKAIQDANEEHKNWPLAHTSSKTTKKRSVHDIPIVLAKNDAAAGEQEHPYNT